MHVEIVPNTGLRVTKSKISITVTDKRGDGTSFKHAKGRAQMVLGLFLRTSLKF